MGPSDLILLFTFLSTIDLKTMQEVRLGSSD